MNETRPQRPAPNPPQATDTSMPDDQGTNLDSELKSALYPPVADGDLGRLGHYRLVRVLGQGGMGMVFEGEDPKLGRAVAIKVMQPALARKPGMKERFFREARAAAVLEHDNIVPIFHLDEQGGAPFLVMPFLRGVTLEDWLRRHGGSVPVAAALRLAADIAAGLAAAHEKGLVHRDVKPANIWLDASAGDRARLLDFGLARLSEGDDQLTQPGALVGTPSYMAPEQARGGAVDARADLFSLGVVLYRLCAGRLPFAGNDPMSVLIALAMEDPVPPRSANPAVPEGLSALVMRLLEKDPARRPVTARAVLEELGRLRLEEDRAPTPAPQPPVTRALPPPLPPRRRRWPLVAAAGSGTLGLLAAAVVWLQTPHGAVRIEANDPGIEVTIDKGAANIQGAGKEPIRLAAGSHGLAVKRGDLEFETKAFTVRKGETVTLKVELRPGKVQVVQGDTVLGERDLPAKPRFPPLKPGWLERVGDLPAKSRAEAVEEELRRRHPGVHPIYTEPPEVKDGQVARLVVGKLSDLAPLAALPELQELKIDDPAALDDLSPLRGLKLVNLEVGPAHLDVGLSQVADLSPLRGMPMRLLTFRTQKVVDLSPVRDLPLEHLRLWRVPMGTNLAVLGAIKTLRTFHVHHSELADLRPFRERSLTDLTVSFAPLTDLAPVAGMPLEYLDVSHTRVTDLSTLKGMQLRHVNLNKVPLSKEALAVLGSLPAGELHLNGSGLRSLDFLKGMKLTFLNVGENEVSDLSPLRGMPLTSLWIDNTKVEDLSPLRGLLLEEVAYNDSPVKDVQVLVKMPLKTVWFSFDAGRDNRLREVKTLETINDEAAAEFWKKQRP